MTEIEEVLEEIEDQDTGEEQDAQETDVETELPVAEKPETPDYDSDHYKNTEEQSVWEDLAKKWDWNESGETDAKTFVLNERKITNTLKNTNHAIKKELGKVKNDLSSVKKSMKSFTKLQVDIRDAEIARGLEELTAERDALILQADTDGVHKIDKKIEKVRQSKITEEPADTEDTEDTEEQVEEEIKEIYGKWLDDNEWFEKDKELKGLAIDIEKELSKQNPDMLFEEILKQVTERINKYRDYKKMDNTQSTQGNEKLTSPQKRVSSVEVAHQHKQTTVKRKLTKKDLTEEELDVCREFIKSGVMENEQEYLDSLAKSRPLS